MVGSDRTAGSARLQAARATVPPRPPARAVGRTRAARRRRAGGAQVQDAVARRQHAPAHEPAGVHAAAGGAGAAAEAAPHQLPWRRGPERQVAGAVRAAGTTRGRRAVHRRRGRRRVRGRDCPGPAAPHGWGKVAQARLRHRHAARPRTLAPGSSRSLPPSCRASPDANGPEDGLRLANAMASVPWRPVIEQILSRLGWDPQRPPNGGAREAEHDLAA